MKCLREIENSVRVRNREFQPQCFKVDIFICAITAKPETLDLERPQRFLQCFFKRAADRHRFAHAFHLRRQCRVGLWKFFKRKPRHFDDAVIDRRFKACRSFARNIISDFVEGITDREFRCDLGDRKSGCL